GRTITWASADSTIASIAANGSSANVTGVTIGTTTVTATTDDGVSGATPVTVQAPAPVTLTVKGVFGNDLEGNGTVTSAPAGINCTIIQEVACSSGCSAPFLRGETVVLTAHPQPLGAYFFDGWCAPCLNGTNTALTCTLVVNASMTTCVSFETF